MEGVDLLMAIPRKRKGQIKISLSQYISNPTGKGSGNVAARYRIRQSLNKAFIDMLSKHRRSFRAIPYLYDDGRILYHVRIPSEVHDTEIMYDVLIEIQPGNVIYKNRNIKLWSNSPSFMYTYAYVYYHSDIMVDLFADKFPNIVLTDQPVIRNPMETLGYEKSTYIAGRYLIEGGCLDDSYIKRYGVPIDNYKLSQLKRYIIFPETIVRNHTLLTKLKTQKAKNDRGYRRDLKRQARERSDYRRDTDKKRQKVQKKIGVKKKPKSKLGVKKFKKRLK